LAFWRHCYGTFWRKFVQQFGSGKNRDHGYFKGFLIILLGQHFYGRNLINNLALEKCIIMDILKVSFFKLVILLKNSSVEKFENLITAGI
jgi:hypothetical protein